MNQIMNNNSRKEACSFFRGGGAGGGAMEVGTLTLGHTARDGGFLG